jgi:AcrR family transcriptional regulator
MPMKARTESEGTRERILEAAWRLLKASPDLRVRIADVAAAAGISRQTVYLHFGDRAGLLLAAVRQRAVTDVPRAFIVAARDEPVPGALASFVKAWLGYIPEIQPVAQMLSAGARLDASSRPAWEDRMSNLRTLILALTRRLAAAGLLQPTWTVETAADWIWHRTHIDGWYHMVVERGWDPADFADRVARSLESDLLV